MELLHDAYAAMTPEAKKEATAKFWATVELEVTAVEDDVKMIFLQNHKIRQCDCQVEEKFGEQNFRVLSEMRILAKRKVVILDLVG